jgi:hypothetical protein
MTASDDDFKGATPTENTFMAIKGKGKGAETENGVDGKVRIGSKDDVKLVVEAQFNPKELEVSKSVPWSKVNEANKSNQKSDQGQGIHLEFTGAEGRSLSLELLFDAYEEKDGTVAGPIATLEKLASVRKPDSKKEDEKRPHRCLVVWGSVIKMECVIENLAVKYTMFSPDGRPLRATATVKLKEANSVSAAKKKK